MATATTGRRGLRRWRGGVTLVEATISVVIVAVMIVMGLHTFGSVARGREVVAGRYSGSALACQLMSEIAQCRYDEPDGGGTFGPEPSEAGGTRAAFDDVDDYHGWSATPPQARDGAALSDLAGWRRSVTVEYVDRANPDQARSTDTGLKRVTVTVTDPKGKRISIVCLRGASEAANAEPDAGSHVTWVGVELQVGSDAAGRIRCGTNVLNQAKEQGS